MSCSLLALTIVLLAMPATALDEELGILEVDAVELVAGREVAGNESISLVHQGYRYRFASAANKATFESNPARYEIQLGGGCGRMGPLSGRGSTSLYAVHDGRLYIFASEGCRTGFLAAPDQLLHRDEPVPEASADELARGRALVDRILKGVGGADRVDRVSSYRQELAKKREYDGKEIETRRILTIAFPQKMRSEVIFDGTSYGWVATETDVYSFGPDEVIPAVPAQRAALEHEVQRSLLLLLRSRHRDGFVALPGGNGKVGETNVELVDVHLGGVKARLAVDRATDRVVQLTARGRGPTGTLGELQVSYADFREIGGLRLPTSIVVSFDGKDVPELSGPLNVTVDGEIDPRWFQR